MKVRLLTILCLLYIATVYYASLMPFDLVADRQMASEHLSRAVRYWPLSRQLRVSRTDMASNFLLYVPMGLLLACRLNIAGGRGVRSAVLAAAAAAGVSLSIEGLQLFSQVRVAGVHDATMNIAGGCVGAVLGASLGPRTWRAAAAGLGDWWRRRPVRVLALGVALILAADALSPFIPTLDVSTVWGNVKRSSLDPAAGLALHAWDHWLIRRVMVYAAWTIMLGASISAAHRRPWLRAAGLAVVFAAGAETAKLLVVSRSANVANVLTAGCGAAAGAAAGAMGLYRLPARAKIRLALAVLLAYIVHLWWAPFDFAPGLSEAGDRLPRGVQWLPLYHYAIGGRMEDIRLFSQTILLSGALGYGLAAAGWLRARRAAATAAVLAIAAGALGLLLEAGQLFMPTRTPSVTDVFCFAAGGALGGWLAVHARRPAGGSAQVPADQR